MMRALLPGLLLAVLMGAPALAEPRGGGMGGGFAGAFGGRFRGGLMHRPGGFGQFRDRFSSANSTHDGRLTRAQAREANMGAIDRHFDEIDTGHKGYVTMDDVRNYRRKILEQRRAAQGSDYGPSVGGPGDAGDAGEPPP